jgi:predicted dehydrogenase
MGKRRIRCLKRLGYENIICYDIRADRRKEAEEKYNVKTVDSLDIDFKKIDAIIVSTPPDFHNQYIKFAIEHKKPVFVEASIILEGLEELNKMAKKSKVLVAPSCTLRFHPAMKKIKEIVDANSIGKSLIFTYHVGQYLPDWHPWEDYRKFYVGKKETGAARELIPFELIWLTWVFGGVKKLSCFKGKISNLDVEIDDVYQVIMKFKNGMMGNLLIDVIARFPIRTFKLLGQDGVVLWDRGKGGIKVFSVKSSKWEEHDIDEGKPEKNYIIGEKMYDDELQHFIQAVNGKEKYTHSLDEDIKMLKLLQEVEKSSDKHMHVDVGD